MTNTAAKISDLVQRAQAGDTRAFEQLIASHLGQIRRFARSFTSDAADADDLAQEALVRAYQALGSFRGDSAFSTWLYRVTRNVFIDGARRLTRQRARSADEAPPADTIADEDSPGQDEALARERRRQQLWTALSQLPPKFRAPLVLFDVEGLSYEEVAAIEGVPVGTIRSRLSRGREHLRKRLEGSTR